MESFLPDTPISNPDEAEFAHSIFARDLAESLVRYQGRDSLVVGLSGKWGSGKSTILAMTEGFLKNKQKSQIIVKFNPWWFSGKEDLLIAFMNQLSSAIGTGYGDKWKETAKIVIEYFAALLEIVEPLSPQLSIAAKLANFFKGQLSSPAKKDVHKIRKRLENALICGDDKIIFLVDDVDRLMPDETYELFSVIKGVANLPNVLYVLAYDEKVVSQNLFPDDEDLGSAFLEKIIQVPLAVPKASTVELSQMFWKIVSPIMSKSDAEFSGVVIPGLVLQFVNERLKTPRDIKRFANSFMVTFPTVRGGVHPIDFFLIEFIRGPTCNWNDSRCGRGS